MSRQWSVCMNTGLEEPVVHLRWWDFFIKGLELECVACQLTNIDFKKVIFWNALKWSWEKAQLHCGSVLLRRQVLALAMQVEIEGGTCNLPALASVTLLQLTLHNTSLFFHMHGK
jgi:hypothetical protein